MESTNNVRLSYGEVKELINHWEMYQKMAISSVKMGKEVESLNYYLPAYKIMEDLLTNGVDIPISKLEHHRTQVEFLVNLTTDFISRGDISLKKRDMKTALESFQASLKICESIVETPPYERSMQRKSSDMINAIEVWHRNSYINHINIGDIYCKQGNYLLSLEALKKGEKLLAGILDKHPNGQLLLLDMCTFYDKLGILKEAQGLYNEALEAFQKEMEINQSLIEKVDDDDEILHRIGINHERMGKIFLAQDNFAESLKSYKEMMKIRNQLVNREPYNDAYSNGLIIGINKLKTLMEKTSTLGNKLKANKDYSNEIIVMSTCLETGKLISIYEPEDEILHRDLCFCNEDMGTAYMAQGDINSALKHYNEAKLIAEQWMETSINSSNWQRIAALMNAYLGDCNYDLKNFDEALFQYTRGSMLDKVIADKNPKDNELQWQYTISLLGIGDVQLAMKDYSSAQQTYQAIVEVRTKLIRNEPKNTQWLRGLCSSLEKLGKIYSTQCSYQSAISTYNELQIYLERLISFSRDEHDLLLKLAGTYNNIGIMYQEIEKYSSALKAFQEFLKISQQHVSKITINDKWTENVVCAVFNVGEALYQTGKHQEGIAQMRKGIELANDSGLDKRVASMKKNLDLYI